MKSAFDPGHDSSRAREAFEGHAPRPADSKGNMKRTLILGGAGFVGSHLTRHLWRNGHHVTVIDDLSTGARSNLSDLLGVARFDLVEQNATEPIDDRFDEVYVLASPGSRVVRRQQSSAARAQILDIASRACSVAEHSGARILFASPGPPPAEPGLANSDHSLRCAEQLVLDRRRAVKLNARVARVYNTYGPGMALDDPRVLPRLAVAAMRGESLVVYGDGQQQRGLCYVDEMVDGLVRLMACDDAAEPVELGHPDALTVRYIAECVSAHLGGRTIERRGAIAADPTCRVADIRRARELVGFEPRISLRDGLGPTLRDLQERLDEATELLAAS